MKTQTFRIGQEDYEVQTLLMSSKIRFNRIPRFGEVREQGKEYQSVGQALREVQMDAVKDFKVHKYSMEGVNDIMGSIKDFNLRMAIARLIYPNGRERTTGYIVILSEDDPKKEMKGNYHVEYCRSKKAMEEITVDVIKPEVIETTDYNAEQMFRLENGMSSERYMSM